MKTMRAVVIAAAGTMALAGAALAAGPTPIPMSKHVLPRPSWGPVPVKLHLEPKWAAAPTKATQGDPTGCSTWTGNWWIFDWGVKNTGTQPSQPNQLTLTCTVAGGKQWPAGQAAYLRDRLCTCNTRLYYVPMIPAGQTFGFGNPNELRFRSYQGTDYVTCNDPNYPHAVVTAKVGTASATVHLCK